MAKIKLAMEEVVPVVAGGLEIRMVLRRIGELQRMELGELSQVEYRQVKTVSEQTDRGYPKETREISIMPKPGRLVDANRRMFELVAVGWNDVTDDDGKPIEFSLEALEKTSAIYPEWGKAMTSAVQTF